MEIETAKAQAQHYVESTKEFKKLLSASGIKKVCFDGFQIHISLIDAWQKFYQYSTSCSIRSNMVLNTYKVKKFRGRVSHFNQSGARKQSFLTSDWLKCETLPRKFVLY